MANICTFEMRVRGKKSDCFGFFNSDFPSYDRGTCGEYGSEEEFILCIFGECRYDVHSMDNGEETLRQTAQRLGVELEVFGYDISEPEWVQHFHYRGGECLHAFDLPTVVFDMNEAELSEQDAAKYDYIEAHGVYVLRSEYNEQFEWDEGEEIMHLPWRITLPGED